MELQDPTEDTGEYRRTVLGHLRSLDNLETRIREAERAIVNAERDIITMKNVLFGRPDDKGLAEGDRGGLVDLFRESRKEMKRVASLPMLVRVLILLNIAVIARGIPPQFWKSIVSFFL